MKTLKILLTILLTLILVVVGFATEILAAVDITVLNPWFYKTALDEMGFYENIRVLLLNRIDTAIEQKESIPDKFKDDAFEIAENIFTKNTFSRKFGDFLGGSVEYVITGKGDAAMPLKGWIKDLAEEIDDSSLVDDIINYEIGIGEIDEADKEEYYTLYKNVLLNTYTGFMGTYGGLLSSTDKLSDFIKMFAPTKEIQDRLEAQFWVIRYWVTRANIAAYIGLAAVLLLLALLFVVWKRNVGVVFKIIGIILIVNSAFFILLGIGLLLSLTVAGLLNAIPSSLAPYLNFLQSMVNPFALVSLGTGIILLIIGIILTVIGGALVKKRTGEAPGTEAVESVPAPEVSEIEYTAGPDLELVSGEDEPEEAAEDKAAGNSGEDGAEKQEEAKPEKQSGEDK